MPLCVAALVLSPTLRRSLSTVMEGRITSLLALAAVVGQPAVAFYIPGVAPVEYNLDDQIRVMVCVCPDMYVYVCVCVCVVCI